MNSKKIAIGREVYLPDIRQYGTIEEVKEGVVSKVKIYTPTGDKVIDTLNMIVIATNVIERIIHLIREWRKNRRRKKLNQLNEIRVRVGYQNITT